MTHINSVGVSARKFIALSLMSLALVSATIPTFSQASTFAFVNKMGEVNTVEANTWMIALQTAFNIHMRSGVILLNSQSDSIVGDDVTVSAN